MNKRISIKEASKLLGMEPQTLRLWLRHGTCPFGNAFQGKGKYFIYYINAIALENYLQKGNIVVSCGELQEIPAIS